MQDRLKLGHGDTLKQVRTREVGFMGDTDITDFVILDSEGNVVGRVEFSEHVAVNGFRRTNTVVQKDAQGNTIVSESWNP